MSRRRKRWVKNRLAEISNYETKHGKIESHEFNTVILIGPTGCGKTLGLAWIGKNWHERGMEIYANFQLELENAHYVTDPLELLTSEGILLVDEIQKYVNSRLSGDSRTLFYSELTSEARKTTYGAKGSLYCSSQRFMNVDIKVRNNMTYVLFPNYNKELHWCTVYAFEGIEYETPLDIFEFDCIPIYELYKTEEKVESIYTDDERHRIQEIQRTPRPKPIT